MNRRKFGLASCASLVALQARVAKAQAAKDPNLLKTTLTPMGAERAGNADGSIPAWTGGYTTLPSPDWTTAQYMPDPFAAEQPILVIDASNVGQYADNLTDGTIAMLKKYPGFNLKVYPTHRTAAAPQSVYDANVTNLANAKLDTPGGRFGFHGGHGGIPFPIPDTDTPLDAGAQIMYNHECSWQGYALIYREQNWAVSDGAPVLAAESKIYYRYPYYGPDQNALNYQQVWAAYDGPPNLQGQQIVDWLSLDPTANPNKVWELLNGQGRVRKAPEVSYDTPSGEADGNAEYDEYEGFSGALDRFDWKYIGKKELYIPYNNNALVLPPARQVFGPHYINPDLVRWEKHRVWVVDATLHPGERHQLPHRRFYVDEDSWVNALTDGWDANNMLYHTEQNFKLLRPELPGSVSGGQFVLNLQNDNYAYLDGITDQQAHPSYRLVPYSSVPDSIVDPQNMAAQAQY